MRYLNIFDRVLMGVFVALFAIGLIRSLIRQFFAGNLSGKGYANHPGDRTLTSSHPPACQIRMETGF